MASADQEKGLLVRQSHDALMSYLQQRITAMRKFLPSTADGERAKQAAIGELEQELARVTQG